MTDPDAGDAPSVWVQWKGTRACMDFVCSCGFDDGHLDAIGAYSVKCPKCGAVFVLPRTLQLIPLADATDHDRKWHGEDQAKVVSIDS